MSGGKRFEEYTTLKAPEINKLDDYAMAQRTIGGATVALWFCVYRLTDGSGGIGTGIVALAASAYILFFHFWGAKRRRAVIRRLEGGQEKGGQE